MNKITKLSRQLRKIDINYDNIDYKIGIKSDITTIYCIENGVVTRVMHQGKEFVV